jgi:hypothetical protein
MKFAHLGRLLLAIIVGAAIGFLAAAIINMFFAFQHMLVIAISISVAALIASLFGYIIGKNQK